MSVPGNNGIKPMYLEWRLGSERERLIGMTDAERAYRKKYVEAQKLAPNEPKFHFDTFYKHKNPIRQIYTAPLNKVELSLSKLVNSDFAYGVRHFTAKLFFTTVAIYASWYYLKYNTMDWTRKKGWKLTWSRPIVYPGTESFPKHEKRVRGDQFATHGFDKAPI